MPTGMKTGVVMLPCGVIIVFLDISKNWCDYSLMLVKYLLALGLGVGVFVQSAMARDATPGAEKKERQEVREEFKTKLMGIRDERRRKLVEKIDAKIIRLNKERTEVMRKHLDKMQELLTNKAKGDKTAAQVAIDTARGAVETQATKEYVVSITGDEKLRANTEVVVKQLRVDLKLVQDKVTAVRKAVAFVLGVEP